ncbi:hypothetical protein KIH31_11970 [Paenarthrobacter sp. DKR-5]|uniref:hypothetical protein n=1 Tax=Paenarthrobacter sp. DKR-5 TaxID=2835535 RepID=UPI001BDD07ED|nr:hypothetical protein [Paenarthrobacter sp. DKR-5]MBT1003321.1 hypothetical protein [Paenarthrobacter sp. DKR-5]
MKDRMSPHIPEPEGIHLDPDSEEKLHEEGKYRKAPGTAYTSLPTGHSTEHHVKATHESGKQGPRPRKNRW